MSIVWIAEYWKLLKIFNASTPIQWRNNGTLYAGGFSSSWAMTMWLPHIRFHTFQLSATYLVITSFPGGIIPAITPKGGCCTTQSQVCYCLLRRARWWRFRRWFWVGHHYTKMISTVFDSVSGRQKIRYPISLPPCFKIRLINHSVAYSVVRQYRCNSISV